MKITTTFPIFFSLFMILLLAGSGLAEDVNITIKHDRSGVADEIIKLKDFDFRTSAAGTGADETLEH